MSSILTLAVLRLAPVYRHLRHHYGHHPLKAWTFQHHARIYTTGCSSVCSDPVGSPSPPVSLKDGEVQQLECVYLLCQKYVDGDAHAHRKSASRIRQLIVRLAFAKASSRPSPESLLRPSASSSSALPHSEWIRIVTETLAKTRPVKPTKKKKFMHESLQERFANAAFFDRLHSVLATRLEDDLAACGERTDDSDCFPLMVLHSRAGNTPKVMRYFEALPRSKETYRMLIQSLLKSEQTVDLALTWFHRLLLDNTITETPGLRIYRAILNRLIFFERDMDHSLAFLLEYERIHTQPATTLMYTWLLEVMAEQKRWTDVQNLVARMRTWGLTLTSKAHNLNLSSFRDTANPHNTLPALQSAYEAALREGLVPDVGTFSALVDAHAAHADILGAADLVREALRRGIEATPRMWHVLFLALLRKRDAAAFDAFYARALTALKGEAESDAYFQSLHLRRLGMEGATRRAVRETRESVGKGMVPRRVTYDLLLKALVGHGHFGFAAKLFEQMQGIGVVGVNRTYHALLVGQLRNVQFAEDAWGEVRRVVEEVFERMRMDGVQPETDTFNVALGTLVDLLGHTREVAFQFLREYPFEPDVVTYTLLLKLVSPDISATSHLLPLLKLSPSIPPSSHESQSDKQDPLLAAAADVPPRLALDTVFFTSLFTVLGLHRRASELHHFKALFMDLTARGCITPAPDAPCYCALMAAHLRIGDTTAAQRIFEDMTDAGVHAKLECYTVLLLALPALDPPIAGTITILSAEGTRVEVTRTRLGVFRGMLEVARVQPDARVLEVLVRGCLRAGDKVAAREVDAYVERFGFGERFAGFRKVVGKLK
ncbi:hypothetical protein BC830DRAFT_307249 [Chytriomyces sp. MP71]|nr:hypothetical protein BC830DRAFT_307249 [Chytriomyces sp. MP71]